MKRHNHNSKAKIKFTKQKNPQVLKQELAVCPYCYAQRVTTAKGTCENCIDKVQ